MTRESNEVENLSQNSDLRDRTKAFAAKIIRLYTSLPKEQQSLRVLGNQMLRSGTSVAANYREGSRARSDAELISKIAICTQEADETLLWLELLHEECNIDSPLLKELAQEADELIAIFVTISKRIKGHPKS
ncbi:MAG: four helix bundle protein [Verrucomicrobia bacterium]|nr:four helix bundle protein [Verrucomicrobiota bacterium]